MNIIITSDNMRRSLSINLRGWRAPVLLLIIVAGISLLTHRMAVNLASSWAQNSDPRVEHIVERKLTQATAERNALWESTVFRLDQEVTDLNVRLWRISILGNEIANRLGLDDEIKVNVGEAPRPEYETFGQGDPADEISRIETKMISTQSKVEGEALRLTQIGASSSAVAMQRATVPMRYPIEGKYWRTSGYGTRKDPFTGRRAFHAGYDFAARTGTPALAGASGLVTYRGRLGRCGKMVEIYHGDDVSTLYCHLSDYRAAVGDFVERGDVIGLVGSTGRSTGPHLHYEIRTEDKPRPYTKAIKEILERRPLVALSPPEDLHLR